MAKKKYMVVHHGTAVRTYTVHEQTKRRLKRLVHPDNLRRLIGRDLSYDEARTVIKLMEAGGG